MQESVLLFESSVHIQHCLCPADICQEMTEPPWGLCKGSIAMNSAKLEQKGESHSSAFAG